MAKLIIVIVNQGKSKRIIKQLAKKKNIGWTIVYGEGSVNQDFCEELLGIKFVSTKEIIIIVESSERLEATLGLVTKAGKLTKPGTGLAFVIDLKSNYGLKTLENNKEGGRNKNGT